MIEELDQKFLDDLKAELENIPDFDPEDFGDLLPAEEKKAVKETAEEPAARRLRPQAKQDDMGTMDIRSAKSVPEVKPVEEKVEKKEAEKPAPAEEDLDATRTVHAPAKADFAKAMATARIEAIPEGAISEEAYDDDEEDDDYEPHRKHGKKGKVAAIIIGIILGVLIIAAGAAAFILYGNVYPFCEMELGHKLPEASAFLRNNGEAEYVDLPEISMTQEGSYWIKIKTGMITRPVNLKTVDTTAPVARDAKITVEINADVPPAAAITTVYDASTWGASWKIVPNLTTPGVVEATVILTDAVGNRTEIPVTITVIDPAAQQETQDESTNGTASVNP